MDPPLVVVTTIAARMPKPSPLKILAVLWAWPSLNKLVFQKLIVTKFLTVVVI